VDLPDIRVVIHAGAPPKLRDYAQESGRAGRDRQASEAIIVQRCVEHVQSGHRAQSWTWLEGEGIKDFVAGYHCQRVIMDCVMNGRMDWIECEEGEEACDVCQRNGGRDSLIMQLPTSSSNVIHSSQEGLPVLQENGLITSDSGFEDSGIGHGTSSQLPNVIIANRASSPISEDQGFTRRSPIPGRFQGVEVEEAEMEAQFEQQQREREWLASGVVRQRRQEG